MNNYVIFGGVALGLILLLSGKRSSSPTAVETVYGASAQRDAAAPAILNAAGDVLARKQNLDNERAQIQLAATNLHDSQLFDFMSKITAIDAGQTRDSLNFAGNNLADSRANKTKKIAIESNERVEKARFSADIQKAKIQAELENRRMDLVKKAMSNDQMNGIIGSVANSLNPGSTLWGGSKMNTNSAAQLMGGMSYGGGGGGVDMSAVGGILQSILGGSNGGALSATGGGVGGDKSGGGFDIMGIISKVAPLLLAAI